MKLWSCHEDKDKTICELTINNQKIMTTTLHDWGIEIKKGDFTKTYQGIVTTKGFPAVMEEGFLDIEIDEPKSVRRSTRTGIDTIVIVRANSLAVGFELGSVPWDVYKENIKQ